MCSNSFTSNQNILDQYNLIKLAIPHYQDYLDFINLFLTKNGKCRNLVIVDLGCGQGELLETLSKNAPNNKFIGIDNSEPFKKRWDKNSSAIRFIKVDILEWLKNQKDSSVDIFVSTWVFHNLGEKYRADAYKQISRILKKQTGIYINADKISSHNASYNAIAFTRQLNMIKQVFYNNSNLLDFWVEHYLDDQIEGIVFSESENTYIHSINNLPEPKIIKRNLMDCISIASN